MISGRFLRKFRLLVFIGEVRMSKSKIYLIFGLLLVFCFALTGCDNGSTGGNSGSRGTLIMQNPPAGGYVYVCDSATPTTYTEFSEAIKNNIAFAISTSDRFTYQLRYSGTSETFSGTGSYLVIFKRSGVVDYYFMGNVSFSNGSATVDFSGMTSWLSLPGNPLAN